MCRFAVVLLVLVLPVALRAQTPGQLTRRLTAIGVRVEDGLADTFGRSVPLIAASAGVTYAFDPLTGTFTREPAIVGQLYLERADTLGRGKLNLSASYQHVVLATLEGLTADALNDPTPLRTGVPDVPALRINQFGIDVALQEFTLSGTYGLTDDVDVNVTLPLVVSDLASHAEVDYGAVVQGAPFKLTVPFADNPSAFGVGDLALRAKWRLLEHTLAHAAAGFVLRVPTGDEERFAGTGAVEVEPWLYVSTRPFAPAAWARLQGHLNLGADFDTAEFGRSEGRWGLGLDWAPTDGVTAAFALLGRHTFEPLAPAGFFDFPRCGPTLLACIVDPVGSRRPPRPLFGLTGDRPDYYDLSVGGRVNLWRDTLVGFANVLVPLNEDGVRTQVVPLAGIEATF